MPSPAHAGVDPLLALADRCVQCGLCLPHCPTYQLDRTETESPRGRIALARAYADGTLQPDPIADAHLDHCLGCRRCEAACPAGVQYGDLLVETRRRQRERREASIRQRAIEWLAARPRLLDRLLGAYRLMYSLLPKLLPRPPLVPKAEHSEFLPTQPKLLPPSLRTQEELHNGTNPSFILTSDSKIKMDPGFRRDDEQETVATSVKDTTRVALFRGCVARRYDAEVHAALTKLGNAAGFAVEMPSQQTCCGALHAHAGNLKDAIALAQRNRAAFAAGMPVLSSASGCHEALADALYGHAPVRDACAFLLPHADALQFRAAQVRVALHVPCTQRTVVKSDKAMRALLARIPQLELIELPDTGCCGAAGSYMFDQPERARALRQPVLDALAASGASVLLSANIGCRLHIEMGESAIPVRHPLEFLAEYLA